ncbi:MAG: transglycosylase SLT domain-containing protein [Chitinivibrionales bacterium]|nr:transglycosylase SLT domain-containing protein [Chitinivibrionales bacterium]
MFNATKNQPTLFDVPYFCTILLSRITMIPSINAIRAQKQAAMTPSSQALSVAREFEAIFASYMIKSMRSSIPQSDFIENSFGESIFTEMLDDEYAKKLVSTTEHGFAEKIALMLDQLDSQERSSALFASLTRQPSWMLSEQFLRPSTEVKNNSGSVQAPSLDTWSDLINEASVSSGIDSSLIKAIIAQESNGNQYALSRAGAKGLMQLMDSTARQFKVTDSFNPRENVLAGVSYLKQLLSQFDGDERLALASYNAGPSSVLKYGGIPPYKETQEYVTRVLQRRDLYKNTQPPTSAGEE